MATADPMAGAGPADNGAAIDWGAPARAASILALMAADACPTTDNPVGQGILSEEISFRAETREAIFFLVLAVRPPGFGLRQKRIGSPGDPKPKV